MIGRLVHRHPLYGEHKKTLKRNNLSTCDVVTSQFTQRERIRSDQYLTLQSPLLISEPWFTCIIEQWAGPLIREGAVEKVNLVSHEVFSKFGSSVVNPKLYKLLKNSFVQHCLRETTE